MTWSEPHNLSGTNSTWVPDHLRATQRGVVVGAIGCPIVTYEFYASQRGFFESGVELMPYLIGMSFIGAWFGLGFLSPVFWLLEKGTMKLRGKGENSSR